MFHGTPHGRTSLVEIGIPPGLLHDGTNCLHLLLFVTDLGLVVTFGRDHTRQDILQLKLELAEVGATKVSLRPGKGRLDAEPDTAVMPPLNFFHYRLLLWELDDLLECFFLDNEAIVFQSVSFFAVKTEDQARYLTNDLIVGRLLLLSGFVHL